MTKQEQEDLERILNRFQDQIASLADARCQRLAAWFAETFPRHSLKILFGMGDELVSVDGRTVHLEEQGANLSRRHNQYRNGRWAPCLNPIKEAIADVWEITDGYRRGCPDDIKVN